MLYGKVPDCENCEQPVLNSGNTKTWEIYQTLNSGFCQDFTVDAFQVFKAYQVRRPARMLRRLSLIYGIALKNAEKKNG
ncbi:MAG: hypothetical protein ACYC6G_19930 [Desulfobaccales bacterium]